jgi:hypothetical protein
VVVKHVPLCELGVLLAIGLCILCTHFFNELVLDMTLDEVVAFVGCLPFLHIVLIRF